MEKEIKVEEVKIEEEKKPGKLKKGLVIGGAVLGLVVAGVFAVMKGKNNEEISSDSPVEIAEEAGIGPSESTVENEE